MTQEEKILEFLKSLIQETEWEGRVYLVGGAVRDQIMGGKPKDLDFIIDGPLKSGIEFSVWLAKELGIYKQNSNPVIYERFGTSKVSLRNNSDGLADTDLEFVAPRKETYLADSRKPDVIGGSLRDETFRRDLTINSLMRNISTGEILDLSERGLDDIKNGIIQTTSEPDIIFFDDPLRMIRCVRFAVKFGFKIQMNVLRSIKNNAWRLAVISSERIQTEMDKILTSPDPVKGIRLLKITGLLDNIIPEFRTAVGMKQNKYHIKDVFGHTLDVLGNTPSSLAARWMALLHDIGKVKTRTEDESGVHFYEHERIGMEMARTILRRLKYPNDFVEKVVIGVRHHMTLKPAEDDGQGVTKKTLRKFKTAVGEHLEDILLLIHADNISHSELGSMPNQVENLKKRFEDLDMPKEKIVLPINGDDLIQMGLKPSPLFRQILDAVSEAWYDDPNITREQAFVIANSYL